MIFVSFLTSICVNNYILILRIVEFFKNIEVTSTLFVGFGYSRHRGSGQDQFGVWFSLAQLPTETARVILIFKNFVVMTSIVCLSSNRS